MAEQTSYYGNFLASLSPRVRERLLSLAVPLHYMGGERIFHEGDPGLYLYIVKSGEIAIEVHVPSKGARTSLTAGPGDIFSWSALVEPHIETAGARAVEKSEVLGIKGGALMDLCREDVGLGFELYRALTQVIAARLIAMRFHWLDVLAA
ncbi:MAG: cyclic nucleotide-binding domain-containing protein [Acidobacteriia bacterium]|nr:cyclic nucleotide-binding domain-containing protein [Terriglobia bacterium]